MSEQLKYCKIESSMKQILRMVTMLSLVSLLSVVSVVTHLSTFPQGVAHVSGSMNHGANSSTCAAVCVLAASHKNSLIERDDDEPVEPFYLQFQASSLAVLKEEHRQKTNRLVEFNPPPDLPAYIRLSVFRA